MFIIFTCLLCLLPVHELTFLFFHIISSPVALRTFAEELGQKAIEKGGKAASKFLKTAAKVLVKIATVLMWLKEKGDEIMTTVVSFIKEVDKNGLVQFVTNIVTNVKKFILKILENMGCGKDRSTDPLPTELRKWGVVILKKLGEAMDHFDMFKTASVWVKTVSSCLSVCEEKEEEDADADEDADAKRIKLVQDCAGEIANQIGKSINPCWYESGMHDDDMTEFDEETSVGGLFLDMHDDMSEIDDDKEFKEDLNKACTVQDKYFLFEDDQTPHGQPNDGVKPVKVAELTKETAGITLAGVSSFVIIFIFI